MITNPEHLAELARATANIPVTGQEDFIRYDLYSSLPYPIEGVQELRFFSVPIGQVIPNTDITATQAWTNMVMANCIEAPKRFIIEEISLDFYPHTAHLKSGSAFYNMYEILSKGSLMLKVVDKPFQVIAPLMKIGGMSYIQSWETTDTSPTVITRNYGAVVSRPYQIIPTIQLIPNMTFNVVIIWDVPIPLTKDVTGAPETDKKKYSIISVTLSGHMARMAQ